jgi:carbon-monoxide dehydrogenase large subunit
VHGDTDAVPAGMGTFASRSLTIGGSAVAAAAKQLREQIVAVASHLLEAAPADIVLANGAAGVRGGSPRSISLSEIARSVWTSKGSASETPPALEASLRFTLERPTVPSGAHIAVVEVDPETAVVTVLRYAAVDDCGRVVNPILAEGQIHGSLAQGLAQALYEQVIYAGDGQLLTGTLLDYTVPTAADLPSFALDSIESPSPLNPLGAKGIGESGTIGAPPAIVNAVADALGLTGRLDLPLVPHQLWHVMRETAMHPRPGGGTTE